jgi:uncharacterized protein (DUF1778 family)
MVASGETRADGWKSAAALRVKPKNRRNFIQVVCIAKSTTEEMLMTTRRATKKKEHPLSMRWPDADIAIIDRAAGMRGRSRTDFVREAAVRAAEDVLMESALVRMSPSGFNAFMKALAEPAASIERTEVNVR